DKPALQGIAASTKEFPVPTLSVFRSGSRQGHQGLSCFPSRTTVARVVTRPPRPSLRTRGSQSGAAFPSVYSSTYTSAPNTATPVGDHGRSAFTTTSTLPSGAIFTTQRPPVAAAYTAPCESTARPLKNGF